MSRWINLDYPESQEGWAHPSPASKSHFFRNGRSMCGRIEIGSGIRLAGRADEYDLSDCHVCTRRLVALAWSKPGDQS